MRLVRLLLSLVTVSILTGCRGDSQMSESPVPLRSFALHDVHGMSGGQALWIAEDGTAVLQVVGPPSPGKAGLWEKRYKFRITPDQRGEMERLAGVHRLLTQKPSDRSGVPDEAHPIILAVTKEGEAVKVRKWANDKHSDFDSLYDYLLKLSRAPAGEKPVYEGAYDWDWRPEGFDSPF